MNNAIEIKGLTKRYEDFTLDHLDLSLPMGCVMGLAGENGAGKSTTIRCILRATTWDEGTISVLGRDNRENFRQTREDIGVVLDTVGFPTMLTAREVGQMLKNTYQSWDNGAYTTLLKRFDLPENKKFGEFSRGMRMKLGIAAAMAHHPRLLILDEATSGLDPVVRDEVVDMLYEYTREEDRSILVSSHILSDLEKLCDYMAFLKKGKLLLCREKDELLGEYVRVQCSREELALFEPGKILHQRSSAYGAQVICSREALPRGMTGGPIDMEDLFIAMMKGGESK